VACFLGHPVYPNLLIYRIAYCEAPSPLRLLSAETEWVNEMKDEARDSWKCETWRKSDSAAGWRDRACSNGTAGSDLGEGGTRPRRAVLDPPQAWVENQLWEPVPDVDIRDGKCLEKLFNGKPSALAFLQSGTDCHFVCRLPQLASSFRRSIKTELFDIAYAYSSVFSGILNWGWGWGST